MTIPGNKSGKTAFVVVVAILSVAAIAINAASGYLKLYFKKLPVELSQPLESLPPQVGAWVQVSQDQPLSHDMGEALGTNVYVFRDFVNQKLVPPGTIAKFDGKNARERQILAAELKESYPAAVVSLAVTYYTGMVDTVAHIPDRCVIADGYQPKPDGYQVVKWESGLAQPIELRFINFEDQTGRGRVDRNVVYFFQTNGKYVSDPIEVRKTLQDLRARYGYYAKIEMLCDRVSDPAEAARTMSDFLKSVMPEIHKRLPDWDKVTAANGK